MNNTTRDLRKYCIEQAREACVLSKQEKIIELAESFYQFITAKDN